MPTPCLQACIRLTTHLDHSLTPVAVLIGAVGAVGAVDTTAMEAHQRVIAAKLLDPMRGAYAVLPHIRQHVRGTLINTILSGD